MRINPQVPADLVIDHSVQVDHFGSPHAFERNVAHEYERNRERYSLLRWAQEAFANYNVVPPGTGIVHQVNLEHLASVVHRREHGGRWLAFPDTVVGTDSHTTMVNGLGVLGWGVGGIEAEAVLLGQPYYMLLPEVVGVRLVGALGEGATATDLVLRVTELLREHGVVGSFVEYYGAGLSGLALPDKATLANMSPEYGATVGFFPVDDETLAYLRGTGRRAEEVERVERLCKEQGLFRTDETPDPEYTSTVELDLGTVEPSVAGPKRPQDRIDLGELKGAFGRDLPALVPSGFSLNGGSAAPGGALPNRRTVAVEIEGRGYEISDGTVVVAAITSCTNTSNPSVMVGAGLMARKARALGLGVAPLGEDESGAGFAGRDRLSGRRRADPLPGGASLPPRRIWPAQPASGIAAPSRDPSPMQSPSTGLWWPRSSRGIATTRPASTLWCEPTTWPRRCWWSPSRSRGASTSTWEASRWGGRPRGGPSSWPISGPRRARSGTPCPRR